MASAFQQPLPFASEVQGSNLGNWEGKKLGSQVHCLFAIPLDRLCSQFLVRVLTKKLIQQHRERFWQFSRYAGTCLGQLQLPLLFNPPGSFGSNCFTLGREAISKNTVTSLAR
jgi:hypothetical protein